MPGLMQWRQRSSSDYTKILWVQEPGQAWKPYTALPPHLRARDGRIDGIAFSEGFTTLQKLKGLGYTLIPSNPAENAAEDAAAQRSPLMPLTATERGTSTHSEVS